MALIQKAFSDIITFSRSSNATRVGPTGVLEYAPHNLLLQSQTFDNASWLKSNSSITANAIAAPDGTVTADKLIAAASTDFHYIYQSVTTPTGCTVSVYMKSGEYTSGSIFLSQGGNNGAIFNLTTGVVTSVSGAGNTASITSVGNGWYRCSVTNSGDPSDVIRIAPQNGALDSFTGDGTSGIYVWGAQLAVGPYALDYVPTTSAAVYGPRFDYDGSGVTIVEPVSRNLLLYSEQFDSGDWTLGSATTRVANAGVAPNGETTADKIYPSSSGTFKFIFYNNIGIGLSANSAYVESFFVKASGKDWCYIRFEDLTNTSTYVYFNLSTGTIGSSVGTVPVISKIENYGNGWYRCSVSGNVGTGVAGYNTVLVGPADADGSTFATASGTDGILLWGAQLELGSTATAYMVSGASNGFRAVPVVSGSATPKGLLVEEQRQNLLTYSQQFDNAAWTKSNSTVTANSVASPDGTVTADAIVVASGSGSIYQTISYASNNAITYSCFIKGTGTVRLDMSDNATGDAYIDFNLVTGVASSPVNTGAWTNISGTITAFGSNWYRCTLTATKNSGTDVNGVIASLSAQTFYVWGAQLEANASFASSYIPTLASAVTRSADVASVNTLSPWYNQSEGSFYIEAQMALDTSGNSPSLVSVDDGTVQNHQAVYLTSGATHRFAYRIRTSNVSQADFFIDQAGSTAGAIVKLSAAYKVNDFAGDKNGGTVETDTVGTVPTVTNLKIADYVGDSLTANGWYRRIAYYPRRLTNAELQALTA